MYEKHPTGLAPEIAFFNTDDGKSEDMTVKQADSHNLLRPETIESLFILYRITKDNQYRTRGYKIFKTTYIRVTLIIYAISIIINHIF